MTEDDLALLRLVAAGGRSGPRRHLLEACGSPSAALAAGAPAWREAGLSAPQVQALRTTGVSATASGWLAAPGQRVVGWHDPDYPALLRRVASPPLALFVAGDIDLLWHPCVAIVGTRAPTAGGRDHARGFTHALVRAGLGICSGLAAGIDTVAHTAALAAGGTTVAVVGCGIDRPYPASNAGLLREVAARGVVVSEHLPGTPARREHFPARNRIIAGLSLGTLVVEAAQRSGALITARLAAEAGREVFALPGSIRNPMARGCHRLIRDGATLVEDPGEIVAALAPVAHALADALRSRLGAPIHGAGSVAADAAGRPLPDDPDYQRLWSAIGHDPSPMDQLLERSGLTTAVASSMLLLMELDGRVVQAHGRYSRKS
ncbi:DNA-processing protein DprA [Luteimonas kalidii]|uniref:DNA-processing protein DprA n=1 Tax=Luteimonas kalidii TaxID=3042025 RepID=A0ABT6JU94_9GAMM|nr:DNA-processing protein DprA [Luteimonas kalidii]MDH5834260.1 DNA-processing protein DprA [Luteimonas kalidii]